MSRVAFVLVFIAAVFLCVPAFGQAKETVKIGDLKLTVENLEIKTGLEIVSKEKKDKASMPPLDLGWFDETGDTTRLMYIDWLDFGKKYVVLKYSLENEGEASPLYVSPTVRYDGVLKATDDADKVVRQARLIPEWRPDYCCEAGVMRIEKGKKVQDALIVELPEEKAKGVKVEVFGWTVFPELGGILRFEIPLEGGKLPFAGKVNLRYEPDKKDEKKLKSRGKVKFGRVQVEIEDVTAKNLNILDNDLKMVFTILEERTIIKLRLENSSSKPVKYSPILLQDTLPGIAIDHQGKWCGMVGITREAKLVECFDLKEEVPAKGEMTDYVILNPPAGAESIRLVLIAESLFPEQKGGGIMIFRIKYKDGQPSEVKSAVMKKSVNITDKTLVNMLEEGAKASEEGWDKKYSGLLVTGTGTIEDATYYEEDHITVMILSVTENSVSQTAYGYTIFMSGDHRSYKVKDKISFKAVLLSHTAEAGEWTYRNLVVYGTKLAKARK